MLTVKTYLNDSKMPNAGVGLFSSEFIPAGARVASDDSEDYEVFTNEEFLRSSIEFQKFLKTYACLNKDGSWVLSRDNAKFVNHSRDPNLSEDGLAARDILPGEEITCDYRKINLHFLENPPVWL